MTTQALCPCESGLPFATCCRPLLSGEQQAATAEALMRSRYTAYTRAAIP
ncbi:MAG: SEC-C metal-binding domain-containing protein, partial [Desulfobulbus sp.]